MLILQICVSLLNDILDSLSEFSMIKSFPLIEVKLLEQSFHLSFRWLRDACHLLEGVYEFSFNDLPAMVFIHYVHPLNSHSFYRSLLFHLRNV